MWRRLFTILAGASLVLCVTALATWWCRPARMFASVATRDDWRYVLRVESGRVTLRGPPPRGTTAGEAEARQVLALLDNSTMRWAPALSLDDPLPDRVPDVVELTHGDGRLAWLCDEPDATWPLFETLRDPDRHMVAHKALSWRDEYDMPLRYAVSPADGDYYAVRETLRFRFAPRGPHFLGPMTPEPLDFPLLRRYWGERLAVPVAAIRLALVAGAAATLPLAWLAAAVVGTVRRHRRSRDGRCPACGYDLRATPGRCPECGAVPPAAAAKGAA